MAGPTFDDYNDAARAIRRGETETLTALLVEHPALANMQPDENKRSLLHQATDWPGHWHDVASSIRVLVHHGANVNVGFPSDSPRVSETPLHWAASSGDVDAVEALLVAGATVDVLGGIFHGCPPYEEAIIFEKYDAARVLLAHGAKPYLPGAAALGMAESIDGFFDSAGRVDVRQSRRPHEDEPSDPQDVLDHAFQFACRAGHLDIAKTLLGRGANPSAISPANTTALEWAVQNRQHTVARWINSLR